VGHIILNGLGLLACAAVFAFMRSTVARRPVPTDRWLWLAAQLWVLGIGIGEVPNWLDDLDAPLMWRSAGVLIGIPAWTILFNTLVRIGGSD